MTIQPTIKTPKDYQLKYIDKMLNVFNNYYITFNVAQVGAGKTIMTSVPTLCKQIPNINNVIVITSSIILPKWKGEYEGHDSVINFYPFKFTDLTGMTILQPKSLVQYKLVKTSFYSDVRKVFEPTEFLINCVNNGALIVVDESHYLKKNSTRNKAVTAIVNLVRKKFYEENNPSRVAFLSATPFEKITHIPGMIQAMGIGSYHDPYEVIIDKIKRECEMVVSSMRRNQRLGNVSRLAEQQDQEQSSHQETENSNPLIDIDIMDNNMDGKIIEVLSKYLPDGELLLKDGDRDSGDGDGDGGGETEEIIAKRTGVRMFAEFFKFFSVISNQREVAIDCQKFQRSVNCYVNYVNLFNPHMFEETIRNHQYAELRRDHRMVRRISADTIKTSKMDYFKFQLNHMFFRYPNYKFVIALHTINEINEIRDFCIEMLGHTPIVIRGDTPDAVPTHIIDGFMKKVPTGKDRQNLREYLFHSFPSRSNMIDIGFQRNDLEIRILIANAGIFCEGVDTDDQGARLNDRSSKPVPKIDLLDRKCTVKSSVYIESMVDSPQFQAAINNDNNDAQPAPLVSSSSTQSQTEAFKRILLIDPGSSASEICQLGGRINRMTTVSDSYIFIPLFLRTTNERSKLRRIVASAEISRLLVGALEFSKSMMFPNDYPVMNFDDRRYTYETMDATTSRFRELKLDTEATYEKKLKITAKKFLERKKSKKDKGGANNGGANNDGSDDDGSGATGIGTSGGAANVLYSITTGRKRSVTQILQNVFHGRHHDSDSEDSVVSNEADEYDDSSDSDSDSVDSYV